MVHQASAEVQQATLKEESKKAERLALNNYNQALVQNTCVQTRLLMVIHALNVST